jgi:DNA-binding winged helix-turn-helix (wHTH) protein
MPSGGGFRFGAYQLDPHGRRLLRDDTPVPLKSRQFDVLLALVTNPGTLLTKNDLIASAWQGVIVSDDSLAQAVSRLRATPGAPELAQFIETVPRHGYRFVEPVATDRERRTDTDLDALLAPHRAMIDGRAALETLERDAIAQARTTFQHLLRAYPDEASVHIGLANACVLRYESTRADPAPDTEALREALTHAREACRLSPDSGEAWATLGFVLERTGDRLNALAALRRGVMLEPDNWRHQLRLAAGSSGEERLRAARRTLALMPECPLACYLAATVYVARGVLDQAEREVDAGLAAISAWTETSPRFSVVALHWLKGLLCLAREADDEALAAFACELELEAHGHLYSRECCANAWYAIGACRLRRSDEAGAREAFEQAIARVPDHALAHAALTRLSPGHRHDGASAEASFDAVVARATQFVADGDTRGAAQLIASALAAAPLNNTGWRVPIEPLLGVSQDRDAWRDVLAILRTRAS